jgi:hypothetical protein
MPCRPPASALLIPSPLPVLAQADLEEQEQNGAAQPEGHQGDREHLAGEPADHRGGDHTGDNQHGGRAISEDAPAGGHAPKVQPDGPEACAGGRLLAEFDGEESMAPRPPASDTVDTLILDLLEWLGPEPRPYAEVLEAWRTSCPRLPVWEDANDRGFIARHRAPGRGALVSVSAVGAEHLRKHRQPTPR